MITTPTPTASDIRELLLTIASAIQPRSPQDGGTLQQSTVLNQVKKRLNISGNHDLEVAVLTEWHELFRTGYLAWGFNLENPNPPFLHFTDRGRRAVDRLSRDPGNPDGYMRHLDATAPINAIARSYLVEGLGCYAGGHYKAAAVMLGAAAESTLLELRDALVARLQVLNQPEPKGLADWRPKVIIDALTKFIEAKAGQLPRDLRDEVQAYWPAFTQQVRATRNDAGHPTSIEPVTETAVHAAFLVFPDLARIASAFDAWIDDGALS